MKKQALPLYLFFILISFSCGKRNEETTLYSKQLYLNGLHELKSLESNEIEYLVNKYDVVSNWDNYKYMVVQYPFDTIGENYRQKRKQYLDLFLSYTKFYSFPIKHESHVLNCFLVTKLDNDTTNYYRFLRVFCFDKNTPNTEPIMLLSFCESFDGLSDFVENTECRINSRNEIESIFISTRKSLDFRLSDSIKTIPDTAIIRMKIKDKSNLEIISKYYSSEKYKE